MHWTLSINSIMTREEVMFQNPNFHHAAESLSTIFETFPIILVTSQRIEIMHGEEEEENFDIDFHLL